MNSETELSFDVAVIGGGPAGIAAATVAAECGSSVVLIDDNPGLGGQIWRGESRSSNHSQTASWFDRIDRSSMKWIRSARVFHADEASLFAESPDAMYHIAYRNLILATGARERFLPFPGWTLPNVMGAGELQALIKSGLPVNGKRIVIAGTGPLLLAVAAYARERGAHVVCIAEQTTWKKFARFGLSILFVPGKIGDALQLSWQLRDVPHWKNCWPVAAMGKDCVEAVRLSHNGRIEEFACDYLPCGFHLLPSVELAQFLGCTLQQGFVVVDENQQTSMPNVYCAGEPTGIGGFELSLIEGQIAGYAAANRIDRAKELYPQRVASQRNVQALREAFELRPELKSITQENTLVCRCEDVPLSRLREHNSWRSAKLHTRCGMGPCQGRICGAAAEFLLGWNAASVRPPLFPVQCSNLAEISAATIPESFQGGSR
jgi:NADPH-dependent 2,4-dienoyl-CoA reductase/sulfur reductase-like enzyme